MEQSKPSPLLRRLGVADITLITIGAVIGSGIFRTPALVAARAHSGPLIMTCWLAGGLITLIGASFMPNWRHGGHSTAEPTPISAMLLIR